MTEQDKREPTVIVSPRSGELWQAVLRAADAANTAQLQCTTRTHSWTGPDGGTVAAIYKYELEDGSNLVHFVEAWDMGGDTHTKVDVWHDYADGFWRSQLADRSNAVVIGSNHYRIEPDGGGPRHMRGHSGRLFRIRTLDSGEVIATRNLWHQGVIPPPWREQLPDTAEFIPTEQPASKAMREMREQGLFSSHPVSPRQEAPAFDELLADADQPSVDELEQEERRG